MSLRSASRLATMCAPRSMLTAACENRSKKPSSRGISRNLIGGNSSPWRSPHAIRGERPLAQSVGKLGGLDAPAAAEHRGSRQYAAAEPFAERLDGRVQRTLVLARERQEQLLRHRRGAL